MKLQAALSQAHKNPPVTDQQWDEYCASISEIQEQSRENVIDIWKLYCLLLKHAMELEQPYRIYQLWSAFAKIDDFLRNHRGFILTFFDELAQYRGKGLSETTFEIIRSFCCHIHNEFCELFRLKSFGDESVWLNELVRLLDLAHHSTEDLKENYSRAHLYELINLSNVFFKNHQHFFKVAERLFLGQCGALERVSQLQRNELLRPESLFTQAEGSISDSINVLRKNFAKIMIYLSVKDFDSLGETEQTLSNGPIYPQELLKYWSFLSPCFEKFIEDYHGYTFSEPTTWEGGFTLPTHRGCDIWIALIGDRKVGKTHFLLSSLHGGFVELEDLSQGQNNPEMLDYNRIKGFAKPKPIEVFDESGEVNQKGIDKLFKKIGAFVKEPLRQDWELWQYGFRPMPDPIRERFATESVRCLTRVTKPSWSRIHLYDPPGESIGRRKDFTSWLDVYLLETRPSCIVLVVSPDLDLEAQTNNYLERLQFLMGLDKTYRHIPIFFVVNKSDEIIRKMKASSPFEENALQDIFDSTEFLSIEPQENKVFANTKDLKKHIANLKSCYKHPAYQAQLQKDLESLAPIVDFLLQHEYAHLHFVYTCSIYNEKGHYPAIQSLWKKMSEILIELTLESRRDYIIEEFCKYPLHAFSYLSYLNKSIIDLENATYTDFLEERDTAGEVIEIKGKEGFFTISSSVHEAANELSGISYDALKLEKIQKIVDKCQFGAKNLERLKATAELLNTCLERLYQDKHDFVVFQMGQLRELFILLLIELGIPLSQHRYSVYKWDKILAGGFFRNEKKSLRDFSKELEKSVEKNNIYRNESGAAFTTFCPVKDKEHAPELFEKLETYYDNINGESILRLERLFRTMSLENHGLEDSANSSTEELKAFCEALQYFASDFDNNYLRWDSLDAFKLSEDDYSSIEDESFDEDYKAWSSQKSFLTLQHYLQTEGKSYVPDFLAEEINASEDEEFVDFLHRLIEENGQSTSRFSPGFYEKLIFVRNYKEDSLIGDSDPYKYSIVKDNYKNWVLGRGKELITAILEAAKTYRKLEQCKHSLKLQKETAQAQLCLQLADQSGLRVITNPIKPEEALTQLLEQHNFESLREKIKEISDTIAITLNLNKKERVEHLSKLQFTFQTPSLQNKIFGELEADDGNGLLQRFLNHINNMEKILKESDTDIKDEKVRFNILRGFLETYIKERKKSLLEERLAYLSETEWLRDIPDAQQNLKYSITTRVSGPMPVPRFTRIEPDKRLVTFLRFMMDVFHELNGQDNREEQL